MPSIEISETTSTATVGVTEIVAEVTVDDSGERPIVNVTTSAAPGVVEVSHVGPQGPKGIKGDTGEPGASLSYLHQQTTPSATWTMNHNLGFKPSVELLNSGGQEIEGDVVHTSDNQTIANFVIAISGSARFV